MAQERLNALLFLLKLKRQKLDIENMIDIFAEKTVRSNRFKIQLKQFCCNLNIVRRRGCISRGPPTYLNQGPIAEDLPHCGSESVGKQCNVKKQKKSRKKEEVCTKVSCLLACQRPFQGLA